jgi:hypothetical protein
MKNKQNATFGTFKFKTAIILIAIIISMVTMTSISAQTSETKHFEVSGEYSYVYARGIFTAPSAPNGWTGGAAYKFNKWVSVYSEFGRENAKQSFSSSVYRSVNRTSVLGGVRFYFPNKSRFTPFLNAGIGRVSFQSVTHNNGQSNQSVGLHNLLYAVGEGVDIALNRKRTIQWRVGAEYRRAEVGVSNNTVCLAPCSPIPADYTGPAFRFHTGIILKF